MMSAWREFAEVVTSGVDLVWLAWPGFLFLFTPLLGVAAGGLFVWAFLTLRRR